MTIYEALRQTLQAVKDWSNGRFVRTVNNSRPDANGNVNVSGGGGGSVELDATLTATNKAAQAKAVGDKVSELNRDLSELDLKKMEYKILTFTGSVFTLDGETLTFSQIKDLCLNTADFVYALYANRLYIPQYISNTNLFFEASYIDSDVPQMHRISINSSNQVSQYSFNLAKLTDIPTAAGTDVQINGTSITVDGVANIPVADGKLGLVNVLKWDGIEIFNDGRLKIHQVSDDDITNNRNNRANTSSYHAIRYDKLDFAVKAAMCDGKGAAWTTTEQAAAQERIGILSSEGVTF